MKTLNNLLENRQLSRVGTLLVLLALAGTASAQSRFALSANVSPILKTSKFYDHISPDVKSMTYPGFGVGANLHYRISPHWSASSGLWLDWTKYRSAERLASNINHHFKIPLLVNFESGNKRLSPYFTVGMLLNKFKYSVFAVNGAGSNGSALYDVAERAQLNLLFAAGVKYKLNDNLSVVMQPTFISNSLHYLNYGYQLSLQTQLICRF